jgi:hypothetical protein
MKKHAIQPLAWRFKLRWLSLQSLPEIVAGKIFCQLRQLGAIASVVITFAKETSRTGFTIVDGFTNLRLYPAL